MVVPLPQLATISNTPILYHGTRMGSGKEILKSGFRLSKSRSYTGHGVCLSESMTIAYEYGMYETGGCVLEVKLAADIKWNEAGNLDVVKDYDQLFKTSGMDALQTFHGNVWILNNCAKAANIRILSHDEALKIMVGEFDDNGPEVGYNNLIDDYAHIWWNVEEQCSSLVRFPKDREKLAKALKRSVGSIRSAKLHEPRASDQRARMRA